MAGENLTTAQPVGLGRYRWTICALVFFATTINYLDRQVVGLVKQDLDQAFGWTKTDYANITVAFQLAYAIGMIFAGQFVTSENSKSAEGLQTSRVKLFLVATTRVFFERAYFGYNMYKISAHRAINCKGNKRGKITELLITNYYD